MPLSLDPANSLPEDGTAGTLVGRAWLPGEGPAVVVVHEDGVFEVGRAGLLNGPDPAAVTAAVPRDWRIGDIAAISSPRFGALAPPRNSVGRRLL
jgi:fumarylacetoacetate (FAA) hydrolase family protein